MDITNIIINLVEDKSWFGWLTASIAAASAFAAATPTPKKGTSLSKIYKVIDIIAFNFGKAKDK